jgi:hypothetical protein
LVALHNSTDTPFLTSDNPVIWLDPSISDSAMRPYELQPNGPIVFIFPIAPDLALYGDSTMRDDFAYEGLSHKDFPEKTLIDTINREVCRFAYRSVFGRGPEAQGLVQEYADICPTVESSFVSPGIATEKVIHRNAFGPRPNKPKW